MKQILYQCLILAMVGCQTMEPAIAPRACGSTCSSSDECRNDFGACHVCFGGRCVDSLPAQPISDAGVDAPLDAK